MIKVTPNRENMLKWICFGGIWIIMIILEFLYIDVFYLPLMTHTARMDSSNWTSYSFPIKEESISDSLLWTILTVSGPLIHATMRLTLKDKYKIRTLDFVRIFGTIPPLIAILTSAIKFTICEPRPNFLARCFLNQTSSSTSDIDFGLNQILKNSSNTINIENCPNYIQAKKGLLSFPSGHASHSFGIFHFLYRHISSKIGSEFHPYLFSVMYVIPIWISDSRLVDFQHHLHDIIFGGLLGIFTGNFIFNTMMLPKFTEDKEEYRSLNEIEQKKLLTVSTTSSSAEFDNVQ